MRHIFDSGSATVFYRVLIIICCISTGNAVHHQLSSAPPYHSITVREGTLSVYGVVFFVRTILAASSRSSQARIFRGLAAIRAFASSTLVPAAGHTGSIYHPERERE